MIGCLRTCVRKQPIIAHYFEFETVLKFYNLEASKYEMGWLANSIFSASGDLLSADNLCKQFGPRSGQT